MSVQKRLASPFWSTMSGDDTFLAPDFPPGFVDGDVSDERVLRFGDVDFYFAFFIDIAFSLLQTEQPRIIPHLINL